VCVFFFCLFKSEAISLKSETSPTTQIVISERVSKDCRPGGEKKKMEGFPLKNKIPSSFVTQTVVSLFVEVRWVI
jgi:hypothetical protein